MEKRSHNIYDICSCGEQKQKRSPRCRKCWSSDKVSLTKHFINIGFKKGYTPWNKNSKGLYSWTVETRQKKIEFLKKNGGPMKGKKHTIESRKKTSNALKGDKAPNWQGGITSLNIKRRHSIEHKEWAEKVYKRDDYTCQVCLRRGIRLEPHHIRPWRNYKEIQYEVNNGITLCKECHKHTFNLEEKLIVFFENLLVMCISKNRVNSGNLFNKMKTILIQAL